MNRGVDIKEVDKAFRDKARQLIDKIDNVVDRPNVYNTTTFDNPFKIVSNPANRGMDNKDMNLNMLNTERYRKANSSFYDTPITPLNYGDTAKIYFDQRLLF